MIFGRCSDMRTLGPLIEHLTNGQFALCVGRMLDHQALSITNGTGERSCPACDCGCGHVVHPPRRFVNQSHYDAWRRR